MMKKWTLENLQTEALKYSYRGDFQKHSWGAYKAALKFKFLEQICKHMEARHVRWTLENLQTEALKYSSRGDFYEHSANAYSAAIRHKILDQICLHMEAKYVYWTLESLRVEAIKYTSRGDFYLKSKNAYQAGLGRNLLDQICQHMEAKITNWTLESLQDEALKYFSRGEFYRCNPGAHSVACKRGILDDICQHMKLSVTTSYSEQNLFNAIRMKFPKTQKLYDRKIEIECKPYIKGFDIDIYVPELRKGIEFDGTYWHSIEGLSKGRKTWPPEDILNYHQIKDDYFMSKGIEILHVNEADWLLNKTECIERCLRFLSNDKVG
jgi:hypothetical protein